MEEEGAQALGDGEDELAVGDGVEELVLEPVGPDFEALGVATGAEDAGLAAEGDEEFSVTALATDTCEAVVEDAAVEELRDGAPGRAPQAPKAWLELLLVHLGESVEMVLDELVEG